MIQEPVSSFFLYIRTEIICKSGLHYPAYRLNPISIFLLFVAEFFSHSVLLYLRFKWLKITPITNSDYNDHSGATGCDIIGTVTINGPIYNYQLKQNSTKLSIFNYLIRISNQYIIILYFPHNGGHPIKHLNTLSSLFGHRITT